MESVIRLSCCPLPSPPLRLSYGSKDARGSTTFRLRYNHATLCLSHFSTRPFRHNANCMLNSFFSEPSKNIKEGSTTSDNYKSLRGVTGVSLVLACILGLFNFSSSSKMNPKFNMAYASPPPPPPIAVAGESLFKMINAEEAPMINAEEAPPKYPIPFIRKKHPIRENPSEDSVDAMKMRAVCLSKSGKKDEALQMLEKKYYKYGKTDPATAQNLQTALIELLIIQGNYEKANKLLDDQIDQRHPELVIYEDKINKLLESYEFYENKDLQFEKLSIAQILLYKAITQTMLKHNKEAAKWWEAFTKTLTGNE